MNKRYWLVLAAVAAVAGVIGIGVNITLREASGGHPRVALVPIAAQHNGQDVMFSQMMIHHHLAAIDMAALADRRARNAQVKTVALDIKAKQALEIEGMKQWLVDWNESEHHDPGMQPAGTAMTDEMAKLEKASGAEFDRMFLTMMIQHHEAAIKMSETEQAAGRYAPAKDLANTIISAQRSEITTLRQLLTQS